jgi:hypothetical protein
VNQLSRKLHQLEKNVFSDTPNFEDTRLTINNAAEQRLHDRAKIILENYRCRSESVQDELESDLDVDVSDSMEFGPEEQIIVSKSSNLIIQRIMYLFDVAVGSFIHLNDPICKWIFYSRLNWFLSEMQEWLFLLWKENEIANTPDFYSICVGEQERRLKPIYDKWRKWLSEESWNKYYAKSKPALRNYEDFTPEEKAQYDRDVEKETREEAVWIEQDKRFLLNKCPTCTEKCKWYYEQIGEKNK